MRRNYFGLLVLVMLITVSILPDFIFTGTVQAESEQADSFPSTISFTAKIRDFTPAHPDFENPAYLSASGENDYVPTIDLVAPRLDKDKKPVFIGEPKHMITSKESFSQWYRDTPGVNTPISREIVLDHIGGGVYNYTNLNFFPINGLGSGNYSDTNKNYHFTTEIQSKFAYNGGEIFKFNGDDDLWVFIDNKLVIDIGGIHEAAEMQINLDDLGLVKGSIYDFRMFHAERQTERSTFAITTSIAFNDKDAHKMSINVKTKNGEYSNNITGYIGQEVELEYHIPKQKINFPEGTIKTGNLFSMFEAFIPPGIEVTGQVPTLTKKIEDGKTTLNGSDKFRFKIGKYPVTDPLTDTVTDEYWVEDLTITVPGRLVKTGTLNISSDDTTASYTLTYNCDSIKGQKVGVFKVASNVQIEVKPFEVEITGPDSLMLGQQGTYTATISVDGISNLDFKWDKTEGDDPIQIIDPKTLNDVSTVKLKRNSKGESTIKVTAYLKGLDGYPAVAEKSIDFTWEIDIN